MNRKVLMLFLLAAVNFTHMVDFIIMMPLGDRLMKLFSISPQQFSILVSSYTFSAAIAAVAGTLFLDRIDRKQALIVLYAGFAVGTIACGYAQGYTMLIIARAATGFFGGMLSALLLSIATELFPPAERGRAIGAVTAGFSAAAALGIPIGLKLNDLFDWHVPFIGIGILAVLFNVLLMGLLPSMKGHIDRSGGRSVWGALPALIAQPSLRWAAVMGLLLVFSQFVVIPFVAPYMVRNVGFRQDQLFYIYLAGGLLTVFSSPWIGRLTDRHGRLRIFLLMMALNLVAVISITHLPAVPVWVALVLTSAFFVFASGRMIPAQAMISSSVPPAIRGSFMSINTALQQLAAGLSAVVSGWIVKESMEGPLLNYNQVGYLSVLFGIACLLVAPKLRPADGEGEKKQHIQPVEAAP